MLALYASLAAALTGLLVLLGVGGTFGGVKTVTVASVEVKEQSVIPGAGEIKTIMDMTKPKVSFSKWNGEAVMGVTLQGMNAPGIEIAGRTEWVQGNETMVLTPKTNSADGGFEIDIKLAAKPAKNVWNFTIEGAENMNFFLQRPLWQEVGLAAPTAECTDTDCISATAHLNAHRPENVVGSYAVYHKTRKDHIIGQTNYATGKLFHIYRPFVTDALGNDVWATMLYSNGVLSVTVPQAFLDTAAYPVLIDPNFGYETQAATENNIAANEAESHKATAPATADIDSITMYINQATAASDNYKGVLWQDSDQTVVTNGIAGAYPTGVTGWQTVTYSSKPSVTSGAAYFIGFIAQAASPPPTYVLDSTPGSATRCFDPTNNYATPETLPACSPPSDVSVSTYVTYTAAATASSLNEDAIMFE